MAERFSILLKNVMQDAGVGSARLEEMLCESGTDNITFRRLSEYLRNVSTPPLQKAKAIMKCLDFPITDEELEESLELNRDLIREEKEENLLSGYNLSVNVNVKMRKIEFRKNATALDTQQFLYNRVKELYGDESYLNAYVERLIKEDLSTNIING